jgi:hypothetical protein
LLQLTLPIAPYSEARCSSQRRPCLLRGKK